MKKQLVNWMPIRSLSKSGEVYLDPYFPQLIDSARNGELLFEIIAMEAKAPISLEDALNLVKIEFRRAADSGQRGSNPGQSHWYYENFVHWIATQGYCIDLTGDEFETASICRRVA
jgi:hypothetical protein